MDNNKVYGLILTDHFISVDNNTVEFLLSSSMHGCVQFLLSPNENELLIHPIAGLEDHGKDQSTAYVYMVDHDGQAHLQEATMLIEFIQRRHGWTAGQEHFFPGKLVTAESEAEPLIRFDLTSAVSRALPAVDVHEDPEVSAHRAAQQERYTWTGLLFNKRRNAPLS